MDNTDITYKSIINSVKNIKPNNYKEFLNKFTKIKELASEKYEYSVNKLSDEEAR